MSVRWLLCLTLLVLHQDGSAYNLDVFYPHVYQSDMPGDYFGFSVALNPVSQDQPAWMMVGAPRGNRSEAPDVYQPGRVFQCQFNRNCVPLQLDTMDPNSEYISSSMLGASQDILNGRFVSCAPRWMGKKNHVERTSITMLGAAYWGKSNDITAIETEKFTPLDEPDYYRKEYYSFNKTKNNYSIFEYGQAGFSSHFPNITKGLKELVLGAPGAYNWHGSTILYRDVSSNDGLSRRKRRIGLGDFQYGPIVIDAFHKDPKIKLKPLGLFGYTVSSGRYYSRQLVHAAGAPRADERGQVFLYNFADHTREDLIPVEKLDGEQVGEYFGAALASGDINGDGRDDLVVGAPLHSVIQDEGRVVIYFGSFRNTLVKPSGNGEITGSVPGGRFGSTISLVDLDHDGHNDLVIAAPYEGNGVVYIYNGNRFGVSDTPTQRIPGSKVAPGTKAFGYSLSRGQDVDGNGYYDLAIGAYKSGHAVILRSRPVIKFEIELRAFGSLPRDKKSFQIESCVKYFGHHAPETIDVVEYFELDPKFKRITLNGRDRIESRLKLNATTELPDNFFCQILSISVKREVFNFLDPIPISLEYKLVSDKQEYKPIVFKGSNKIVRDNFCKECPVLTPNYKAIETTQISFLTDCKSEICKSQLSTKVEYIGLESDNFVVGKNKTLNVRVSIKNDDKSDPAYWTRALISLPVPITRLPLKCQEVPKENITGIVTSLVCNIANPLKPGHEQHIELELDMEDVSTTHDEMSVTAKAFTNNELVNIEDIESSAVLGLVAQADTFISGKPSREFFLFHPKDSKDKSSGRNITFSINYQVEKLGPSPIDDIRITFKIPIALKNGERFLQLIGPPNFSQGGKPMSCTSRMLLQNNSAQPPATIKAREQRRKRDVENAMMNENINEYPSNRTMYVNCTNNNDWVCAEVSCLAGSFSNNRDVAKLSLNMVINTPVLETFLGKRDIILLGTEASVYILDPPVLQQISPNLPDIAYVNAVFMGPPTEGEVQLWIIALSIIAGILLLLAVVTGLVKAGFFERKDKEALAQLKQETEAGSATENPTPVTDES